MEWLTSGHVPHTAAVRVIVSRYVLWADMGKAQLCCQAVRPSSQYGPRYLPVRTAPVCCYGPNRKHSLTLRSYRALLSLQTVVWLLQRSTRWVASCQLVRTPITGL